MKAFILAAFCIALALAGHIRGEAEPVKVDLYFESYCPGCENFITTTLKSFLDVPELKAISTVTLYPYGNAHILTRDPPTFQCQHGDAECYGNYVEDCVIEHYPENWFDFIYCAERAVDFSDEGVKKCADASKMDSELILTCAKGTEGPLLHLKAGDATPADHKWVPWLTINGEVTRDLDNLKQLVCDAYKGEKPAACSDQNVVAAAAEPVKVELFYESLCPGCRNFIIGGLKEFLDVPELKAMIDLNLYPYGNAHTLTRDPPTFQCQHDEEECYGNYLENCAIAHYPENWFDFLYCIEKSVKFGDEGVKACAEQTNVDSEVILTCAKGTEGPLLHLKAGDATPADHEWVPWLLIDGQLQQTTKNFKQVVCDLYKGEKPAACFDQNVVAAAAEPVKVDLYFESYCPGCENFITTTLKSFLDDPELKAISNVSLYPYGNAHILTRDPPTFRCQHGDDECYGNYVEDCVIEHYPENWFDFIYCAETAVDFSDEGVKKCADASKMDSELILTCAKGTEGPLLHLKAGDATPADHKWVPWLTINGEVTEDLDNLKQLVCDAYKGEKPATCSARCTAAEPVKVDLYFESYCPGCENFITTTLKSFLDDPELKAISTVTLYPYGNAHILTRDPPTFRCQHGDDECYGNYVEDCVIEHYPENWFDFIYCAESAVDFSDEGVKKCADASKMDSELILTCAKGTEGPLLHLKAGDATPADHQWVPWLTINGEVTEDLDNLKQLVCDAYKGEKPATCKN